MASQAAQWRRNRSFIKGRSSSNLRRTASRVASRFMQLHLAITMPIVQVIVAQFQYSAQGLPIRGRGPPGAAVPRLVVHRVVGAEGEDVEAIDAPGGHSDR